MKIPKVTFRVREGDEISSEGGCPIGGEWLNKTTNDYFKNKRVVLFSLPGAFTPTCSSQQLPGFEEHYDTITKFTIDEVYCISVNDSFVMNAWRDHMDIEKVKFIPDGSGEFTRRMGMLVNKENLGFGYRSWRYAMIVNDGVVERVYEEAGKGDNTSTDPFEVSKAENVLSGC